MKKYFNIILILVTISSFGEQVYAIPAFARKYKTSCSTCHIAVTKRNAFGEAFRRNGYNMPERDARLIKEPPLNLGADAWKELFPDAIWPSSIPGSFPISAYAHMRAEFDLKAPQKNQLKFDMPFDYGLMYGAAFSENFSVFFKWSMEFDYYKLFCRINNIIGPKGLVNLKIGAFEPGITEGYTTNQNLTLDYASTIDYSAVGDWKPYLPKDGLELNGILDHNFQYCVGIVNSVGNVNLNPSLHKDYFGRIGYKFGGVGLDGSNINLDSNNNQNWIDDSFTIGVYTYFGNSQRNETNSNVSFNNSFNRIGLDARYQYQSLDLHTGIVNGVDNNPFNNQTDIKSNVYFLEADYIFYPWLIGVLRYENIESKIPTGDKDKYSNFVANVTFLYRQNIRMSVQGLINIQKDKNINNVNIPASDNTLNWIKFNTFFAF